MCENCKFYEKENEFVGRCDHIKMMIMPTIPIDEYRDLEGFVALMVRREFKCNQFSE